MSLLELLDKYGFKTAEQKIAFVYLMQVSGIPNAEEMLKKEYNDDDNFFKIILELVDLTQRQFTIRSGTQERWSIKPASWMEDKSSQGKIFAALKILNMLDVVEPNLVHRDAICVFGTVKSDIDLRLSFAAKLLPTRYVILLSGERYVTINSEGISVDGSREELETLAQGIGKPLDKLTEADLMKISYESSALNRVINPCIISTPKGDLPRATTATCVFELCKWLTDHSDVKTVTFISNQPFVEYQKAIIGSVFENQRITVAFEVVGPEFDCSRDHAEKIKEAVEAIGSQILAATPGIVADLNLNIKNKELKQRYVDIYAKQPLTYSSEKLWHL